MFQSTPAYGGRLSTALHQPGRCKFQSTPAYGGRPDLRHRRLPFKCFNPRPRTAGDLAGKFRVHVPSLKFQSTPAYGGRRLPPADSTSLSMFQSTPAYGGRRPVSFLCRCLCRFQSTPAYGGRRPTPRSTCQATCFNPRPRTAGDTEAQEETQKTLFQSTPAYGGRRSCPTQWHRWSMVSIHARVRRATRPSCA